MGYESVKIFSSLWGWRCVFEVQGVSELRLHKQRATSRFAIAGAARLFDPFQQRNLKLSPLKTACIIYFVVFAA